MEEPADQRPIEQDRHAIDRWLSLRLIDQRLLLDWRLELDLRQSRRLEKAVKQSAECQHNNGNNDEKDTSNYYF